jgi:hypothetical protein
VADFFVKAHDTSADLTGATVKFNMKAQGASTPKVGAAGTGACTIITAASGIVQYKFLAADTDTPDVNPYQAEWQITFTDGTKTTCPNPGYDTVTISADLDGF